MQTPPLQMDRSRDMDERSWWDLWNTSYRAQDNQDTISTQLFAHVAAVIQKVAQGRPGRILEVACGTGTLSRQLNFSNYHGLDISPAAIDVARRKLEEIRYGRASAPTYEAADFHDWPHASDPVDIVLCVDAISCFRDQEFVLRKMAGTLRAGGLLIVTTINPIVYTRIRRVGGVRLENGPVSHWLSRRELHDLVQQADLTIEHSYTIMPRGNMGWLRIINATRLNEAFGPHCAALFRRVKECVGLGQYRVLIARKAVSPRAR
jgi:2-polyprenyl-3-methyl-5-hydroxy-6-metoxy-1,4-benzoquinol methylase